MQICERPTFVATLLLSVVGDISRVVMRDFLTNGVCNGNLRKFTFNLVISGRFVRCR